MTEKRIARVWRRASDKWDRSRVPPAFDEGTRWERVEQAGRHIGARRRMISHLEDGLRIDEVFALAEGEFVGFWSMNMRLTAPPEPTWTAYSFAVGENERVTFERQVDSTVPRFGIYPIVAQVPFEAGHLNAASLLDDRSGEVQEDCHLVSVGWDDDVNGQWWRIDQYHDGDRMAAYWLDAQHRLMRSDWDGATLEYIESKDEALGELAPFLSSVFAEPPDP
ncbi:MAG: hypothetical protein ACN4GK_09025 [Acidimicrobiia bacterium]